MTCIVNIDKTVLREFKRVQRVPLVTVTVPFYFTVPQVQTVKEVSSSGFRVPVPGQSGSRFVWRRH